MPISQEKFWKITCDECGESFPEGEEGGGYVLSETEEHARQVVVDTDGEIDAEGKVTCAGCVDERDLAGETDAT
jgi:hypothetical protein